MTMLSTTSTREKPISLEDEFSIPNVRFVLGNTVPRRYWYGKKREGQIVKYKFKTTPYRHQKDALRKLISTGFGGALLMEPRTGKTKTVIDYAAIMHQAGKVDRVLVVMPFSVIDVWVNEIKTHCPCRARITIWDKDGRKEVDLPRWGSGVLEFVLVNYDAFSTAGAVIGRDEHGNIKRSRTRGGRFELRRKLEKWQPQLMILDESHRIKTPSSRKTTAIVRMAIDFRTKKPKIPYRVIMTGTAVTKKKRLFDIYSQWQFLNPKRFSTMDFKTFKKYFAVWTERNGYPQWLRNDEEKVQELRALIHKDAYAITRQEALDLPDRLPPVLIHVKLSPENAQAYDDMAEDMVAKIHTGEITEASIKLVQRVRLSQMTSGVARTLPTPAYPKGRLARIGNDKLQVLKDLLIDQFEAEEKVVVGARWIADIEGAAKIGAELKVPTFLLYGKVPRAERTKNIEEFRKVDGPALFIMQPAAGSLGIDLRSASTMIWLSLTNSYVDFTQAEDRIALSNRATRFIYLLAEGTFDEIEYQGLLDDADVSKAVAKSPEMILRR